MQIQTTRKDLLWSYLGYFFNLGVNILLLPLILRFLKQEEIGIWYTFGSIYSFVLFVDFGFSSTFTRSLTYAWSGAGELQREGFLHLNAGREPNYYLFSTVLATTKKIFFYMSLFVLLIMISAGSFYVIYITRNVNNASIIIAYLIYATGAWTNLFFNYRIIKLKSIGAYKGSQQAVVFSKAAQLLISGIGVIMGGGLVVLSCSYLISGLIMRIAAKYIFQRQKFVKEFIDYRNNIVVTREEINKTFKTLWKNTKNAGIYALTQTIINQSGLLICSAFTGLVQAAGYGLCFQLVYMLCAIGEIFYNANTASLTNALINRQTSKQQYIFSAALVVLWIVVILGIICLSLFGPMLLKIIGSNTSLNVSMFGIMGFYVFLQANCSLYAHLISLKNTYPFIIAYIVSAIFQIFAFLFLVLFSYVTLTSILIINFITRIVLCISLKWPRACLQELDLSAPCLFRLGFTQIHAYFKGASNENKNSDKTSPKKNCA